MDMIQLKHQEAEDGKKNAFLELLGGDPGPVICEDPPGTNLCNCTDEFGGDGQCKTGKEDCDEIPLSGSGACDSSSPCDLSAGCLEHSIWRLHTNGQHHILHRQG